MEVLRTKHPYARYLSVACLDMYTDLPRELIPMEITKDIVPEVAGKLYRWSGPGGNGLSEPSALAPAFRSGERGVAADGSRLFGVVR